MFIILPLCSGFQSKFRNQILFRSKPSRISATLALTASWSAKRETSDVKNPGKGASVLNFLKCLCPVSTSPFVGQPISDA